MNDVAIPGIPAGIEFDTANDALRTRIQECLAHPLRESFRDCLERLASMASGIKGSARLYHDFAPMSLGWAVMRPDGSCWMAGGLIYHGPHDGFGSGGAPTFSVSLSREAGWQLHS